MWPCHPYGNILSQIVVVLIAATEPTFLVGVCKLSQSVTQVFSFVERHEPCRFGPQCPDPLYHGAVGGKGGLHTNVGLPCDSRIDLRVGI